MARTRALLLSTLICLANIRSSIAQTPTTSIPTQILSRPTASSSVPTVPPCAQSCLAEVTSSLPCDSTDSTCLCLHTSTVESSVQSCLLDSQDCPQQDAEAAKDYYGQLCQALGFATDISNGDGSPNGTLSLSTYAVASVTGPSSATDVHSKTLSTSPTSTSTSKPVNDQHGILPMPVVAGLVTAGAIIFIASVSILIYVCIQRRSEDDTVSLKSPGLEPRLPSIDLQKRISLRSVDWPQTPDSNISTQNKRPRLYSMASSFETALETKAVETSHSHTNSSSTSPSKSNPLRQNPTFSGFDFGLHLTTPAAVESRRASIESNWDDKLMEHGR